jgi:hypothetical protein
MATRASGFVPRDYAQSMGIGHACPGCYGMLRGSSPLMRGLRDGNCYRKATVSYVRKPRFAKRKRIFLDDPHHHPVTEVTYSVNAVRLS